MKKPPELGSRGLQGARWYALALLGVYTRTWVTPRKVWSGPWCSAIVP